MAMGIQYLPSRMFMLCICMVFCTDMASTSSSSQNLQVQDQLKLLNKPPVRSIESSDGGIIDCINITHQPAFDQPLLRNHTIQMTPSFHPESVLAGNMGSSKQVSSKTKQGIGPSSSRTNTQLWHLNGRCPKGTIPIRRTRKGDLLRASSIKAFGKKKHRAFPQPRSADPDQISQSGHQHAIAYEEGGKYYGAKATINVWEPKIQQPGEFSLSQIWILGGSFGQDLNSIEAGWQVSPDLYGDNHTRLFTYWTSDAYGGTGCYNLLCSGFVQTNKEIAMGGSIYPVSSYHASQYDISILVWKDPKDGNWWMKFGKDKVVGYWPSLLFSHLSGPASMIEWGGEVVNSESNGQHTSTQMGSGHFPKEGFGRAGYFKAIEVDGSNNLRVPKGIATFIDQPTCYDVEIGKVVKWGTYFYFGGPGRGPNCP